MPRPLDCDTLLAHTFTSKMESFATISLELYHLFVTIHYMKRKKLEMKDSAIRKALKKYLFKNKKGEIIILEELGILHGAVRIDLVVLNCNLHGYEVKSDFDNLKRLPEQVKAYNSVFDFITLVVGYKHAPAAMKLIPEWWGIKIVELDSKNKINFITLRENKENPKPDCLSIAKLLWKDEALSLLGLVSSSKGFKSKRRNEIYAELVKRTDLNLIRAKVREHFRSRKNWRVGL